MEVNSRVNYPLKRILIEMSEDGDIQLNNTLHMFAVSWFTMQVANCGMKLFVNARNQHPLLGMWFIHN